MKSDFDGDFYGSVGVLHGCVVVSRGLKGDSSSSLSGPGSMFDYAFISPRNGKVYKDWIKCK